MTFTIAPISEEHVRGFHACLDQVARERRYLAQIAASPVERIRSFVQESIKNDSAQFVALDGGRVVGWADILPAWAHASSHCGSLGMGVLPEYRGQGIGTQLLMACLAKAEAKGITRVELETRSDNLVAIKLYERLGFAREALKRNAMRFDGKYYDALQMSRLASGGAQGLAQAARQRQAAPLERSPPQVMIALVPTTRHDIPLVVASEADDDTAPFIIPWTAERHLAAISDPDCSHLSVRGIDTHEWLGFVLLFGLSSPHRAIELRRIVCSRKGLGIGRAAVRAAIQLAFGPLEAHRLWLDVMSTNSRARSLYVTEGFVEEGVMRECVWGKVGFESLVLMSMLCTDPGADRKVPVRQDAAVARFGTAE